MERVDPSFVQVWTAKKRKEIKHRLLVHHSYEKYILLAESIDWQNWGTWSGWGRIEAAVLLSVRQEVVL